MDYVVVMSCDFLIVYSLKELYCVEMFLNMTLFLNPDVFDKKENNVLSIYQF